METGASREERFLTLLHASSALSDARQRRDFLERVCDGDPALLADLIAADSQATITLAGGPPDPTGASPGLAPGQTVADRFQIVRPLGEGGMAVVYEALDQKLGERRALKFPKAGHSGAIPPEARSALRVTHDNICRIHEIHSTGPGDAAGDFISMEFLEGETLLSRWAREALSTAAAVEIARQLCRGLDAAHRAHILHRDLKSNNVMLAHHADGSLRVVIMDFGLARPLARGERPGSSSLSGTMSYIAPERWKGAAATPQSDVYALGVILYEMLAGGLPFPAETAWRKRLSTLPDPPSRCERAPDPRWDSIVLRCLEPDPEKRTASAAEVLAAIEKAFGVSHRKQWIAAAAVALLTAAPAAIWRDRIWGPPPLARMAVLPFTGTAGDAAADQAIKGGLYDLAGRLESLGSASRRVVLIPLEDSLRNEVNSPAAAAARLGATHVFSGTIGAQNHAIAVHASVTDARTGEIVRDFSGEFSPADLAALSTSLAGVVTSAFHLDRAPPASIQPAAYPAYAAGLASLRGGSSDYEPAIASFQEALKQDGSSPLIHAGLADALLRKFTATNDAHWLNEASELARHAETLQPDSPPVLLVLGSIERAQGRPERAIELFRRAAELEPDNSEAWRRTGVAFQRMGRDPESISALRKAIQLAPGYYAPHRDLGFVYFHSGRNSEAVEEFRKVTALAPELSEGYWSLGGVLLVMEKEAEAEQALRQSVKLKESRAALNNLGVLLRYQGRDREAAQVLGRALESGADDIVIRLNLGNALLRIGRPLEARENFQRASDLARASLLNNPRDFAARARLAYCMVRLGEPSLAGDEALQAARLAPSDYSVLLWSVMTLESLGRRQEALPLLANASYERLRDMRRQPDLAALTHDPQFSRILEQSQIQKRRNDAISRDH